MRQSISVNPAYSVLHDVGSPTTNHYKRTPELAFSSCTAEGVHGNHTFRAPVKTTHRMAGLYSNPREVANDRT